MNRHAEIYAEAFPEIIRCSDAQDCPFFFNNGLFLLSRLVKAPGWYTERLEGALVVHAASDWAVVLPMTRDRDTFRTAVLEALLSEKPLLRVPGWIALPEAGSSRIEVRYLWPDYICRTVDMQTMAGRRLKGIRQRLNRLDRDARLEVIRLSAKHQQEAGELARLWYRQRQPVLKTMYLFEENIWLFENWSLVTSLLPGAFGIGVLLDGRLVAANLSCPLSETYWACHTERYDGEGPLYSNQLAFREACRSVDPIERPYVNDGPAEAPYRPGVDDLAAFKHRLAAFVLQPFRLLQR
ncbi:MAG: phosphatidylglycerol lysyltransferase domain-containing protein [Myxococcales bacterium]|nr:DUF2156 domain-containing protein [Polyangiaceae bacterium]MDW8249750.1 phosphatidylglycerol lysyltransferase domain-containing protein [Myxococcales bacterium]